MMVLALILFGALAFVCFRAYSRLKKVSNAESTEVRKRKKSALVFGCIGLFGALVCLGDLKTAFKRHAHRSPNTVLTLPTSKPPEQQPKIERRKPKKTSTEYASDGLKCTQCFGHYQNGYCTQCGAASPERIQESYSKAANCQYCQGTGVVPYGNRYKVCPSCRGSGKQTY